MALTIKAAAENVLWKLERKELVCEVEQKCDWAKIDKRDATIKNLAKAIEQQHLICQSCGHIFGCDDGLSCNECAEAMPLKGKFNFCF